MWQHWHVSIGELLSPTECPRFFLEPRHPKQHIHEALRRYFGDQRPSKEVAREVGYTAGSFRVLYHQFRRESYCQKLVTQVSGGAFG